MPTLSFFRSSFPRFVCASAGMANNQLAGTLAAAIKALPGFSVDWTGNPGLAECALGDYAGDCQALVAASTAWGSAWTTPRGTAFCGWPGVACSAASPPRVTALALQSAGIAGTLPAALGSLASLQRLDLANNSLSGTIPAGYGSLAAMTTLLLGGNRLSGTIAAPVKGLPLLANWSLAGNALDDCGLKDTAAVDCSALLAAAAAWGVFTGRAGTGICGDAMSPAAWPGVVCDGGGRVQQLDLGGRRLGAAVLPQLGNLTALTRLSLRNASLTGTLPATLASLTSLRRGGRALAPIAWRTARCIVAHHRPLSLLTAERGIPGDLEEVRGPERGMERGRGGRRRRARAAQMPEHAKAP